MSGGSADSNNGLKNLLVVTTVSAMSVVSTMSVVSVTGEVCVSLVGDDGPVTVFVSNVVNPLQTTIGKVYVISTWVKGR